MGGEGGKVGEIIRLPALCPALDISGQHGREREEWSKGNVLAGYGRRWQGRRGLERILSVWLAGFAVSPANWKTF